MKFQLSFRTEDGRTIDFLDGWFEGMKRWPYDITNFQEFVRRCIVGEDYPRGDNFGLNKIITTNTIIKLLEEYDYPFSPNDSLLDICTGPAILPRIFKYLNLADYTCGIDIRDRENSYSDERLLQIWRAAADQAVQSDSCDRIFSVYTTVNGFQTGYNNAVDLLLDPPANDPSGPLLDEYVVKDFLTHDFQNNFNLVTLTAGLEYFNVSDFFEKLSNTIRPGGFFITFNDYFFELYGQSMHLPMDAPWLHARVSKEDFFRYYVTFHPDLLESVKKAYYFPDGHHHFTVADYKKTAEAHGFELLGYRRRIRTEDVKNFLFTDKTIRDNFKDQILPDVRAVNGSVKPEDLFTSYLTMVYRRK